MEEAVKLEIFRWVFGITGMILSNLALFLIPSSLYVWFWYSRPVGDHPPGQHLLAFFNCMLWVLYGLPFVHPNSTLVITSNGVGSLIALVYLVLFAVYSKSSIHRSQLIKCLMLEIMIVAIIGAIVLNVAHGIKHRSQMVGIVAAISHVGTFSGQLLSMVALLKFLILEKMVLKTKNVEHLNAHLICASHLSNLFWMFYAVQPLDLYILVPNAVGLGMFIVHLVLVAIYEKTPTDGFRYFGV